MAKEATVQGTHISPVHWCVLVGGGLSPTVYSSLRSFPTITEHYDRYYNTRMVACCEKPIVGCGRNEYRAVCTLTPLQYSYLYVALLVSHHYFYDRPPRN